jgi:membrane-associated phospholipid phosphatase
MPLDTQITLYLNGFTGISPLFDGVILFLASYLPFVLLGLFLAYFFLHPAPKKAKYLPFGLTLVVALVARFGAVEAIRAVIHRPRPYVAHPEIHALFSDASWSFPSGHATFFFALATWAYFFDKRLGVMLYAGATLVSLARVVAGVHYLSDVVAGALLGVGVAWLVRYLGRAVYKKDLASIEMLP